MYLLGRSLGDPLLSWVAEMFNVLFLSTQTRASRLSFNDVIKRLAQQPEDSPTFISKKVRREGCPDPLNCCRLCSPFLPRFAVPPWELLDHSLRNWLSRRFCEVAAQVFLQSFS